MKFTKEQEAYLDQGFEGTEWCPHCEMETDFVFHPMTETHITCTNCGKEILPCSLCDSCKTCNDCTERIRASLIHYNDMWDETVNGTY